MFSTKDLYMKACMRSTKLHAMTDSEKVDCKLILERCIWR